MRKTKQKSKINMSAILALCSDIERKEGDGSMFSLGSSSGVLDVARWSTGLPDLDAIIGGGMPEGRVIEIYGAESGGKTSLAYQLCAQHDICLHIPVEGTFTKERATVFGNRAKQMLVYSRSKYGEKVFNRAIRFAEEGIPLIVIDSVPSMQPLDDVNKVLKAVHNNTDEEVRIGGIARLMTKYLPVLEGVIEQTGTTVVFINQIRDKVNSLPFGDNVETPGGHKLKHAASIRIQVARKEWIKIPNYSLQNTAKDEVVGMIMTCRVVKSKVCNPQGRCEIPMFFDRGFVRFEDIKDIRDAIREEHKKLYRG